MANEISGKVTLRAVKGGAKVDRKESFSIDMAGESFFHAVQNVGTGNETLECYALSNIDAAETGMCFLKNLDATNYVEIGLTSSYTIKLLAGECALFRAAGALFARANTAAVELEILMIEL